MTGTITDGAHGGRHQYSADATRVLSDADYVKGEEFIRNSSEFATKRSQMEAANIRKFAVEVRLKDVYGVEYKSKLKGYTRTGTRANPTGAIDTDFTDGTLKAVYKRDATSGEWNLSTMYPEPR